ncbi:MAG: hypothetical protein M3P50_01885 [Actinomycetota bacterium]|nr:hypothetical protein [Actinomycetota bacterium]
MTVDNTTAKVSAAGRFSRRIRLDLGDNDIELTAVSQALGRVRMSTARAARRPLTIERDRSAAELAAIRALREQARQAKLAAARAKLNALRAGARTIPYNQLNKNPERYAGQSVVYRGQIFQIQEEGDSTVILLSVTDEGYGLSTDNIYVEYDRTIQPAEEDIITVYGKVVDQYSYETQIGGETYVPRIRAEIIDE